MTSPSKSGSPKQHKEKPMMHRFRLSIRTRAVAFEGSADVYGQTTPQDAEFILRGWLAEYDALRVTLEQTMDGEGEPEHGV